MRVRNELCYDDRPDALHPNVDPANAPLLATHWVSET